jgi:Bacterial dnaA protein helix-turn-helix
MGYAETQDEIIRASMCGRGSEGPRHASVHASLLVRATPSAPPVAQPETVHQSGAATEPVQQVAAPTANHGRDADLAAAVDAARRLRHMAEVQQIVAAAGLTLDQVRGHGRRREETEVRRIVAAYLRRRGCSLPEIGRVLNRDHTSVLNLLRPPRGTVESLP